MIRQIVGLGRHAILLDQLANGVARVVELVQIVLRGYFRFS